MKRIATLTFHRASNYGAMLQTMALEHTLNSFPDVQAEVLDYRCEAVESGYRPWHLYQKNLKQVLLMSYLFFPRWIRNHKFAKFLKQNISLSEKSYHKKNVSEAESNYDCFFTGSDQVWSPVCTNGDKTYFLDFVRDSKKKVSYAASFGFDKMSEEYEEHFGNLLRQLSYVSIREKQNCSIIEKLDIENSDVHIDPVFLLKKAEWEAIAKKPKLEDYILIYLLQPSPQMIAFGKELAEKTGKRLVTLNPNGHGEKGIKNIMTAGPEEFLGWICYADYVLTNSFHGLAFSILFHKNFWLEYQGQAFKANSRLKNLVELFQLENCVWSPENASQLGRKVDFDALDKVVQEQREHSFHYLKKIVYVNEKEKIVSVASKTKETCCGCGACQLICPTKAIMMEQDKEGFYYPKVSSNECISCGLCMKKCFMGKEKQRIEGQLFYAARQKNKEERKKSRSGGVFYEMALKILQQGGVVYGVGYDNAFRAVHKRATTMEECKEFRGVKYVQSPAWRVFLAVMEDLSNGKMVFFSGTPCQVNGLKTMLAQKKVDMSQLICCDNVCHGVPSVKIWEDYLKYIQKKTGKTIVSVCFRNKAFGWSSHKESFWFDDNSVMHADMFARLFWKDLMLRPSCYECSYSNYNRVGDITIGDFWGIEKVEELFADGTGVSVCMINTEKGLHLWNEIQAKLETRECRKEECLQPNLQNSTKKPSLRETFWKDYQKKGFAGVVSSYAMVSYRERIAQKIKNIGKNVIN